MLLGCLAWLLWPNVAARFKFALRGDSYAAAANWVVSHSDRPEPGEILYVRLPEEYRGLTSSGLAFRFFDGSEFVYFIAGGEVTMPDGLLYSSEDVGPPASMVNGAPFVRLKPKWWQGGIIAAFLCP